MSVEQSKLPVGIIGIDKVGSVLTRTFANAGFPISCVVAIDSSSATPDSKIPVLRSINQVPTGRRFLLMFVPDKKIRIVTEE